MIYDLVERNRSYRRFHESQRISHKELTELVGLARISPSAANLQNIRYYLIHDDKDCDAIFPHLKWANYLRYWDGPVSGERPSAYIVLLVPAHTTKFHYMDTGIAAQSIMLGAVDRGLGGCMIASVDKPVVQQIFNLPFDMDVALVLALGYPSEKVIIDSIEDPEDVEYWRDDEGCHHVPKRRLEELILNN